MKTNLLLICSILAFFFYSCSVRKNVEKRVETRLTAKPLTNAKIQSDIDFYLSMVEKISPSPYLYTKKSKIDSISLSIKSKSMLQPLEFYEQFLRLQGSYNVGHMYSNYPRKEYEQYKRGGGLFFPLKLVFKDDMLFVEANYSDNLEIQKDDIVLSINGLNADSLFSNFLKYEGGLNEYKRRGVARSFGFYLWINKIYAPFNVKKKNRQGELSICQITRNGEMKKQAEGDKTDDLGRYITYSRISDTIAFINFKSMAMLTSSGYDNFLKETFKDINRKKTSALVIDLSENSGGVSTYGEKLISYFATNSYRMSADKQWKVSKEYKKWFKKILPWYARPLIKLNPVFRSYYRQKDGTFYKSNELKKDSLIHSHVENELKFKGKVYVIIGNKTFSSAVMTANAIEDYNLATLVGEPTGESPNDLGEIVPVRLPYSGITCWIPSALFTRANGDTQNPNPVVPAVLIEGKILYGKKHDAEFFKYFLGK